jgi:hypothetical protein
MQQQVEKPVESVNPPAPISEPVVNSPVVLPMPKEEKPDVDTDMPKPVTLTIIETPPAKTGLMESETEEPISLNNSLADQFFKDEEPIAPVSLGLNDSQPITEEPVEVTPAPIPEIQEPVSQPLEADNVGDPVQVELSQAPVEPVEEPLMVAQLAEERPVRQMATPPVKAVDPSDIKYEDLALILDANQFDMVGNNKIMFTLRPDGILNLKDWKLYVFAKKPKNWNAAVIDDYALAIISGKGITPLSVFWDGTLERGGKVEKGKYIFVVVGEDASGTHYMSKWHKFKVR